MDRFRLPRAVRSYTSGVYLWGRTFKRWNGSSTEEAKQLCGRRSPFFFFSFSFYFHLEKRDWGFEWAGGGRHERETMLAGLPSAMWEGREGKGPSGLSTVKGGPIQWDIPLTPAKKSKAVWAVWLLAIRFIHSDPFKSVQIHPPSFPLLIAEVPKLSPAMSTVHSPQSTAHGPILHRFIPSFPALPLVPSALLMLSCLLVVSLVCLFTPLRASLSPRQFNVTYLTQPGLSITDRRLAFPADNFLRISISISIYIQYLLSYPTRFD